MTVKHTDLACRGCVELRTRVYDWLLRLADGAGRSDVEDEVRACIEDLRDKRAELFGEPGEPVWPKEVP